MHRFATSEALAEASKPKVEKCFSVSMLKVGVKTEEAIIRKKDGSPV